MAFTGTPVIQTVTSSLVVITGISLAASAVGTISLFGDGGDVELPDNFDPKAYDGVTLNESLEISYYKTATSAAALNLFQTVDGAGLITLTNNDGVNATPNLKIFVRFH